MKLENLINWSKSEFTQLPWRKDRTLYKTLVSEIMLQQTTVGTVRNHYEKFLQRFPDLQSLSAASNDEMTIAWKGLGYYRRARNLKGIAETIVANYQSEFPHDQKSLKDIPGIGPYTANALVAIGMDRPGLAVDANLERVISRLFGLQQPKGLKLQKHIQELFDDGEILKFNGSYRELNEALMDLGRTYCQARKVSCELCPLRTDCHAFKTKEQLSYPRTNELTEKISDHELHLLRIVIQKNNQVLVYKKEASEWLSGQFELPTFVLDTTDKKLAQYPKLAMKTGHRIVAEIKSTITKYKIRNSLVVMSEKEFKQLAFPKNVEWRKSLADESNLTTTTSKILKQLSRSL